MKGIAIVYIRRIVLCIVTPAFCGLIFISYVSARPSASIITKAFYQQHFRTADRMFFSRENVRRERRWFTPRLYKLMLYELHRADLNERDSDGNLMKPHISGDVFTNSESPPQAFRIGRTIERRNWATVEVICYWNDNTVGNAKRKVVIRLIPNQKTWLIDNVIEEDGRNIIDDFSRPNYFSE